MRNANKLRIRLTTIAIIGLPNGEWFPVSRLCEAMGCCPKFIVWVQPPPDDEWRNWAGGKMAMWPSVDQQQYGALIARDL